MLVVKPGELVDVLLKDVEVVTASGAALEVTYRAGANREAYALYIKPDSPNLVVTRIAPAEWPPRIGDVWADAHGGEWWCRPEHEGADAEAYLQSQKGGVDDPSWVLRQYGPMALVYRKGWSPAPAADVDQADEPKPAEVDKRTATIAGLRALADLIEAQPTLPTPYFQANIYVEHLLKDPDEQHAELERIARVLDVEPDSRDKEKWPGQRHRYARKALGGGVSYEAVICNAYPEPEPAADITPSPLEEVAGPVAAGPATAPNFELGPVLDEDGDRIAPPHIDLDEAIAEKRQHPEFAAAYDAAVEQDPDALDQLAIAATDPAEAEVGGYWCTVNGTHCTAETDPCHLCPTAAEPIPVADSAGGEPA